MSVLEIALSYLNRGWSPTPVKFKSKEPVLKGWQDLRITTEPAPQFFNGSDQNIGIVLEPSKLTDVDLDSTMAVRLAPHFLHTETLCFGRASRPRSHWLFTTNLAETENTKALEFKAPDGSMILELRIGSPGHGAQTIFPGSIHSSGEPVTWW